ncbi:MAG: ATP-binding protein [Gammaproteobacteria bacterium]|nr:ATP-binding protein [Gammaproteobacteria bacterium]
MTHQCNKPVVEICIPSELGYEKVAIAVVATAVQQIGLTEDKIEDLKTAVGEACTNAIEHGNLCNSQAKVRVVLAANKNSIKVNVIDDGYQPIPDPLPDRNNRSDFRGMGLYLMRMLMDEVKIESRLGRNEVRMISYRKCLGRT